MWLPLWSGWFLLMPWARPGIPNGDVCHFLTLVFRCRFVSGEARVNDDESLDVGWFLPKDFPDLMAGHLETIRRASDPAGDVHYRR